MHAYAYVRPALASDMYTCKHMRRRPSSVHVVFHVFYIMRLEHTTDKDARHPTIWHISFELESIREQYMYATLILITRT